MTETASPGKVLVLGDDMRSFLAVVRSLGRAGLCVHAAPFDRHAPALASRYLAKVHHLPDHVGDGEAWCNAMEAIVAAERFDLIIPCCDRGILMFDAHRARFGHVRVALPSAQVIACLFDKQETRRLALELGVAVAPGRLLRPGDDAAGLVAEFGLPLLLKPSRSYRLNALKTRGKVEIFRDQGELDAELAHMDRTDVLVEGFFSGTGVGLSVIAAQGRVLTAFQHRRLHEPSGGGGSSLRVSEPIDPELLEVASKMCRATALAGVAMFEFRVSDETGAWILVEVNARFWGSLPLPLGLGVDFPRYLYELLVEGRETAPVAYEAGVRSRNLLINGYDIMARGAHTGWRSVILTARELGRFAAQPWSWLRGTEMVDEFVADDPRPGFREIAHAARLLWRLARQPRHTRPTAAQRRAAKP